MSNYIKNINFKNNLPLEHKNVKAFVTHGGMMGTQEAIFCGVPMIGIPVFGDQHHNIYNYVDKKIAVSLSWETIDEKSFTRAIFDVLKNPIYRYLIIYPEISKILYIYSLFSS